MANSPELLRTAPAFRVEGGDGGGARSALRAEVFLEHRPVLIDDEGHDARYAVVCRRRDQPVAAGRLRRQHAVEIAIIRFRLARTRARLRNAIALARGLREERTERALLAAFAWPIEPVMGAGARHDAL